MLFTSYAPAGAESRDPAAMTVARGVGRRDSGRPAPAWRGRERWGGQAMARDAGRGCRGPGRSSRRHARSATRGHRATAYETAEGRVDGADGMRDRAARRWRATPVAAAEPPVEAAARSEEHTSELQSRENLVC